MIRSIVPATCGPFTALPIMLRVLNCVVLIECHLPGNGGGEKFRHQVAKLGVPLFAPFCPLICRSTSLPSHQVSKLETSKFALWASFERTNMTKHPVIVCDERSRPADTGCDASLVEKFRCAPDVSVILRAWHYLPGDESCDDVSASLRVTR